MTKKINQTTFLPTIEKSLFFKFKYLVIGILLSVCVLDIFIDELGFPSIITYLLDLLNLFILLIILKKLKSAQDIRKKLPMFFYPVITFSVIALISGLLNLHSIFLFLYGARTLLRYYVFIVGCFLLLSKNDLSKILNIFFYFQIFSFILSLYQKYFLNLTGDYIGGIFGHGNGAILNPFQIMLYAYFLLRFLNFNKDLIKLLFVSVTSLFIAGIADEKAFFVYFVAASIICVILGKKSIRTIFVLFFGIVSFLIGLIMLASIDSTDSIYILFNFDAAENYLNYSSSKISRINPFEYINNNFFGVNRFKYLFGYGLGNCSYSNINIFNSTFATLNEGLSYQYYPHSFVTLETGYLGFISFTSIFIFNIIFSYKKRKINYFYSTLSIAMSCVALLSFFVSTTLINNFSYIVYFGVFIFPIYYYQTTKISKIR